MSKEYDEYLSQHIENVQKGYWWMVSHGIIPPEINYVRSSLDILDHDASKRSPEEYEAYDDYFYGKEGRDEDDIRVINDTFDYAWLHHIHNNPHHWQYWVLLEDDEGAYKPKALMMPEEYMYEMIADWWSFSWKDGNLKEIFDWWKDHEKKMLLHPETRKMVEDVLSKMKTEIEKEKNK